MEAEKDFSNDNVQDIIQKQRSEYIEEISNIQCKFDEAKLRLTEQVEKLSQQNNAIELNSKIRVSELENENIQLLQQIQELEKSKSVLSENLKTFESDKIKLIDTLEMQYKEKIKSLENELNERNASNQEFIDKLQDERAMDLMQLKEFYESEKQRLETKITEERKNNKIKLDQQQEELDERLKEEQSYHEEEIEMLQEEIKQLEERCKNIIKQAEQDQAMSTQKIEYLEKSLKEAKEDLVNNQNKWSENLVTKINNLMSTNLVNEWNNIKAMYEKEQENKRHEFEIERQWFKDQINDMAQEIDRLRSENQELKDNLIKQKLDFTRDEAIVNQKIEFKDEKIKELTDANEQLTKQFDEKLKNIKQDLVIELDDKINKLEAENTKLWDKYEAKRKAWKDIENDLNKLKAEKDRESIIMEQKIFNLENSNKKLIECYSQNSSPYPGDGFWGKISFILFKTIPLIPTKNVKLFSLVFIGSKNKNIKLNFIINLNF